MFSVVTVYNNEQKLNENLLDSLRNQTANFELTKLDNTNNKFKSAAEALNYGGMKSRGKYVMFVHQDVKLSDEHWLNRVEKILEGIPDLGVAGCSGKDANGQAKGFIDDSGQKWGKPLNKPTLVQTLDESVLIIPKDVFDRLRFDSQNFNGWHGYGADYSLSVTELGLNAYVIPAFIHHYSSSSRRKPSSIRGLFEAQEKLIIKHRRNHKCIYMTCGFLPTSPTLLLKHPKLIYTAYQTFGVKNLMKLTATPLLARRN
jgi:hypothetical protein